MGLELDPALAHQRDVVDEAFCVDHLFLLVGKNPLPNYVAAELQLRAGGRLYLVHSETTRSAAERLRDVWIAEKQGQQPLLIPIAEADSSGVEKAIAREVNQLGSGRVGLNYTGGTKVMAVHSYQAMRSAMPSSHRPVLSYLDARSNRLILDCPGQPTQLSDPVLYYLKPTLEQIVQLHAAQLLCKIDRRTKLPELASALAATHQLAEGADAWRTWCDQELRPKTRTRKRAEWDEEKVLASVVLQLPSVPVLGTFVDFLASRLSLASDRLPLGDASRAAGMDKIKHLCEWLDGKWLEHHVLALLQDLRVRRPGGHVHDAGMGIRPKVEDDRPEFDVDIGAMQGYQLYALSCTTEQDAGMCKLKLFEALVRARNMAGDEAYVGLVCYNDRSSKLERAIGRSWDAKGQIRVFGRPELPELSRHLADWFESKGR